jgi:hypothetical protein
MPQNLYPILGIVDAIVSKNVIDEKISRLLAPDATLVIIIYSDPNFNKFDDSFSSIKQLQVMDITIVDILYAITLNPPQNSKKKSGSCDNCTWILR